MNIVKAGYQVIPEGDSVTKKIERIARVCYKSEELIGEGTDLKMLNKLVERKHYAMLEHASLAYIVPTKVYDYILDVHNDVMHVRNKSEGAGDIPSRLRLRFSCTDIDGFDRCIVSANIRAWLEFFELCEKTDAWSMYLKSIVDDVCYRTKGVVDFTECANVYPRRGDSVPEVEFVSVFDILTTAERMIHEDFSVLFTVDRGVTHEMVHMRDASFAQESTRYCNYSSGKFGNEITVIKPVFFDEKSMEYHIWEDACEYAEYSYNKLTQRGVPAQQARSVLPTEVKADIVITTNLVEWRHIFELRACDLTGPAHPQMKEVMCPLCDDMKVKYEFAFGDLEVKHLQLEV